jgi:hypothetical protein
MTPRLTTNGKRVGRPKSDKVDPADITAKAAYYFDNYQELGQTLPTMFGLAVYLDTHADAISQWRQEYPSFDSAVKKGEQKQQLAFGEAMMNRGGNVAGLIFLAKNAVGWADKQETRTTVQEDQALRIQEARKRLTDLSKKSA